MKQNITLEEAQRQFPLAFTHWNDLEMCKPESAEFHLNESTFLVAIPPNTPGCDEVTYVWMAVFREWFCV